MLNAPKFVVGVAAAAVVYAACGSNKSADPSSPASKPSGTITVLAASSLTNGFTALGGEFEAANPGALAAAVDTIT